MVVIVDSAYTLAEVGTQLLTRLQPYFPTHPIMLVSLESNGYRAYASFETHRLLALIQLEQLTLGEIDLSEPPPAKDESLPF